VRLKRACGGILRSSKCDPPDSFCGSTILIDGPSVTKTLGFMDSFSSGTGFPWLLLSMSKDYPWLHLFLIFVTIFDTLSLLFVSTPKYVELSKGQKKLFQNDEEWYNKNRRRGGRTLYFSRSWTENETWVPLIEKAFAKLHGDYASLTSGATGEAIEDMTGSVILVPTKHHRS
jgi:hypothetical protein